MTGVSGACVFGSWAAGFLGDATQRPVADIDVLVLGDPDRDELYARVEPASKRLGRPVQVTIREPTGSRTAKGRFTRASHRGRS